MRKDHVSSRRFEPPHARDLAPSRTNAPDRLRDRFRRYRHVESVGMNERRSIPDDGNVAAPEYQVTAPKLGRVEWRRERLAQRRLLHVAVARAGHAAGGERDLEEARAVEAETGLAAPQVGHSQEAFGNRDEIALGAVERGEVARGHVAARRGDREWLLDASHREPAPEREGLERRKLGRRTGEDERAQRGHFVGRRWPGFAQRAGGDVADISVRRELPPGPAFLGGLVDRDAFAL